jgi:hypothetical protein
MEGVSMTRNLGVFLLAGALVHCGDSVVIPSHLDTGSPSADASTGTGGDDAGLADTAPEDVGTVDTAPPADTGSTDAAPVDAAPEDTGPHDATLDDTSATDLGMDDVTPEDAPTTEPPPEDVGEPDVPVAPPAIRLKAPLSTTMSTSNKPTFEVFLEGDVDGAIIEVCKDHGCSEILETFPMLGTVLTAPKALTKGVIYWRAIATLEGVEVTDPTVVWQLRVGHGAVDSNTTFGSFFDVNLDGYTDAMVGACGMQTCTEKVYIHHGGPDGLSTLPNDTLTNIATPFFGRVVSTAGDVNGDGYPDVLVGTQLGDAAVLFLNGPNGLSGIPSQTWFIAGAFFGFSLSPAGDLNGDGYGDIVIGAMLANTAFVYYGGPEGPGVAPDVPLGCPGFGACGTSVAGAGDVNGDGYGDLLIGDGAGNLAYVFHGGPNGPAFDPASTLSGDGLFGTSVDIAGDVNGDGFADIVVGAPDVSIAYLYLGSAEGIQEDSKISLTGGVSQGISVSSAGDVNGDGLMDVVTGSKFMARVYLGNGETGVEPASIEINGASVAFADSVAGIGDCDGNGFDDVLIGATDQDNASLYLGNPNGFPTVASKLIYADGDAPGYGYSVAILWGTGTRASPWEQANHRPQLRIWL